MALTACASEGNSPPRASSSPTPPTISALSGSAAPAAGPLGLLAVPALATPYGTNTNSPMGLDAFVQGFYVKTAWEEEEALLARRGFKSGAIEGWINPDGSQQQIYIARFATANGALSQFLSMTSRWRAEPKPARMITDAEVGGLGWVNPTLDSLGNTKVEIAVRVDDTVIDVLEYTALSPDIAAAESLILEQYDSLKTAA